MLRIGLVGLGHWGSNLLRAFNGASGARVSALADLDSGQLATAAEAQSRTSLVTSNPLELFRSNAVDAVVITTATGGHFELALAALEAGKHVLVAKPMTTSLAQADRLVERASALDRVLMVDHTCVYDGAVRAAGDLVRGGDLGAVASYDATRTSLGGFQRDSDVLWDLAVHDLSIMDHVLGELPVEVSARAAATVPGWPVHTAHLVGSLESGAVCHLHASWLAPERRRETQIVGASKMLVLDELASEGRLVTFDAGVEADGTGVLGYRRGSRERVVLGPEAVVEPLASVADEFVGAITSGRVPATDGRSARRVIGVLEAAERSLAAGGRPQPVP